MNVFDNEWQARIKERYGKTSTHPRPEIYYFATQPKFENERRELRNFVGNLQKDEQMKIISKINGKKTFVNTLNELVVGLKMKQLGYNVNYEKTIAGLTPDWFIHCKTSMPGFIIEVVNVNPSKKEKNKDHMFKDLISRILNIEGDYVIKIIQIEDEVILNESLNKEVANDLRKWIKNQNPIVGQKKVIRPFEFETIGHNKKYSRVQNIGPYTGDWAPINLLKESIEEKVSKYNHLARQNMLPLVIAVIADFHIGLSEEDFDDVLRGKWVVKIFTNKRTLRQFAKQEYDTSDAIFQREPGLSAGIWLSYGQNEWTLKPFLNPKASYPLFTTAFEKQD
jgi:hypothetical protein